MNIYEEMGIPLNDLTGLSEYNTVPTLSILARTLYSEASTESDTGKVAICYVAQNRVKTGREFGSDMTSVLLNVNNRFDGLFTENARRPTVSSQAWIDSCDIARQFTLSPNPIGGCLWYNTEEVFTQKSYSYGGYVYYRFKERNARIVEQKQIGKHIFFRVDGY